MSTRVLVVGVSTRAAAESAARAGFEVIALDAFGDRDQHPSVRACALPRFTTRAAVQAASEIECDAVAYLSPFENHPPAVAAFAEHAALWGNSVDVLRRARNPIEVARLATGRGFDAPRVVLTGEAAAGQWLVKPLASGGGHGIHRWTPGQSLSAGSCLQEFVDGVPASLVFVAAAGRAVSLGMFRQLIGDAAFGAREYRYCGNVVWRDDALAACAGAAAAALADAFELVGVNGIDFIARHGRPHVVEVNPRWCASMELIERNYAVSAFRVHADACVAGMLPDFSLSSAHGDAPYAIGKAVVFARHDIVAGDGDRWLNEICEDGGAAIRDVPRAGTYIAAGRPICTVFAAAADSGSCYTSLVARAARVYADVAAWQVDGPVR